MINVTLCQNNKMVKLVIISTAVGNIISFITGASLSWSSPILPKLNATNIDEIPFHRRITTGEYTWIGSLLSLGAVFGPYVFGFLEDKIGRKFTVLSLGIPFFVAYLMLAFSKIVEVYFVARLLSGIGMGGAFAVLPTYIAEIAEDKHRGAFGSVMNISLTFGLLIAYCVGPYAPMVIFNVVLAVISFVFMVVFFFLATESPYYYVAKSKHDAAAECLHRLRGSEIFPAVLEEIEADIEEASKGKVVDLFKTKGLIKALIISLSLVALQRLSGVTVVLFYAHDIFVASGGCMAPEIASIIIGAAFFATSFVTPYIVDRLGRKILLYISAIGMLGSQVSLGVYFVLLENGKNVDAVSWLPVLSLVNYILTYNIGFGPLPFPIMGELFPSNVKAVASSLTSSFCWFTSFVMAKIFITIVYSVGMSGLFFIYAFFCVVAFFFTLFYVIETKGKTLHEIQKILEA